MSLRLSKRKNSIKQSEIRAMTRECQRLGGINMAQGVCDLDVPESVLEGAIGAMRNGVNTYTPCEGIPELRKAIADKEKDFYGMEIDAEAEVMVSSGATGAFYAAALAILDPGDEVIILEPYYGYHVSTLTSLGCVPRFIRLEPPDWSLSRQMLEKAVTGRTRAIMINSPGNPSGKVFTRDELEILADFAGTHDFVVFSDEIYEHFVYDGLSHIPPASIAGLRERTVTISGFSKVFSITGWRLGYAIAPPEVIKTASHFNDLIYVCAPSPLQMGAARGLVELGQDYYDGIAAEHLEKRDRFCSALSRAGLNPFVPKGAYYVLTDISHLPGEDDKAKVMYILERSGIAAVPGSAFYSNNSGPDLARFCFAKKDDVLDDACERLGRLVL